MDLYIIRHAQSTNNALPAEVELRERVCDPLLTELGYRQADHVAEHLATGRDGWSEAASADPEAGGGPSAAAYGITRLVCSPMRRTLLTAQPASQALGLRTGDLAGHPRARRHLPGSRRAGGQGGLSRHHAA